jgi:hypothetical protein
MRCVQTRLVMVALGAILCVFLCASGSPLFGQEKDSKDAPATAKYAQSVTVQPGALSGTVFYMDGKTPVVKTPVRLWSTEQKKFIQQRSTDEKGAYKLGELVVGRYLAVFGDRVFVDLRVDKKAALAGQALNIIIPRGDGTFAQMAPERKAAVLSLLSATEDEGKAGGNGETNPEAGEGMPLRTLLIIGGGAATAVGVVELIKHDEDEDGHHVSP